MVRGVEQARTAVRLPLEIGKIGVRASLQSGKWAAEQVVGNVALWTLGAARNLTFSGEHIAKRLETTQPLSEAYIGAQEVSRGLREDDAELTEIGERRVTLAVVTADNNPIVPDDVTGAVVDIARGLPVDPLDTPSVRPELAEDARVVMGKFGDASETAPPAG